MAAKTATELGLATGKWTVDPVHSQIGFSARHMMVSKVRGYFTEFSGDVEVAEDLTQSTVSVTIQAASITTLSQGIEVAIKEAAPQIKDGDRARPSNRKVDG